MNEELKKATLEVLGDSRQSKEFQRRILKLLENVTLSNYTDTDVRDVIELAAVEEEE
jgi:hypothetical protein